MEFYNKIMIYFWLLLAIVTTLIITYMGFTNGFERWLSYYAIPLIAFLMFFVKRWMMKRMKKHIEYMNQKGK